MGVLALVEINGKPLYEGVSRLMLRPAEGGHTAARLAEFDSLTAASSHPDVLFVGSSLTYRGIDARVFEQHGLDVFALGFSSQTPLNYAPLLGDALPLLRPHVVAFEVAPDLLASDGMEAFYVLAVNQPLGKRVWVQLAAVRSVRALNLVVALAWYRLLHPLEKATPLPPEDPTETYVGCGFTARTGTVTPADLAQQLAVLPPTGTIEKRQLRALERSLVLASQTGARVALVAPPTHPTYRAARTDFAAHQYGIQALARRLGVPFIDFSHFHLDPHADFSDLTHLSARGVERYNTALADSLGARGLIIGSH